jgi:hypothetical protein
MANSLALSRLAAVQHEQGKSAEAQRSVRTSADRAEDWTPPAKPVAQRNRALKRASVAYLI